jgi:hypothetical protein
VDIPHAIDAVSEVDERNVIDQLVQELNMSFMTELAECTVDRDIDSCPWEEDHNARRQSRSEDGQHFGGYGGHCSGFVHPRMANY